MKPLKPHLKQENVDSNNLYTILINYSKRDCVKVALYAAEDCFHINPTKESQLCIDLIKKWLTDEKSVSSEELRTAADAADAADAAANAAAYWAAYAAAYAISAAAAADRAAYWTARAAYWAVRSFGENRKSKLEEYLSYARLFAYEDLDFPYKDISKTFNLDNPTDLNIFLDFLTDNYPTAITYDREEYFKTKLAKEYLRVIYQ